MLQKSLALTRIWCAARHGDQKYGGFPYLFHLDRVAGVAVRFGFERNLAIMKSCYGHDLKEDRGVTDDELLTDRRFTPRQVRIISAVSDEEGATRHERKVKTLPKIKADRLALVVKLCDRIANVEFSIETANSVKFHMYREEHSYFEEILRNRADIRLEPMWAHLEQLLTTTMLG